MMSNVPDSDFIDSVVQSDIFLPWFDASVVNGLTELQLRDKTIHFSFYNHFMQSAWKHTSEISFLDTLVKIDDKGNISTALFAKQLRVTKRPTHASKI